MIASPLVNEPQSLSTTLATLMDYASVDDETTVGRVNINQAPRPVLFSIPQMTEDIVNAITAQRIPETYGQDMVQRHAIWPLAEGYVEMEEMKAMLPYITTGGDVFRGQVIGYSGDGTSVTRAEVVIDGIELGAPVLLWKDMNRLGLGLDMRVLTGESQDEAP